MYSDAVTLISILRNEEPSRVHDWDKPVVAKLEADPATLHAFRFGSDEVRWDIYAKLKYKDYGRVFG
ncbi:MFS transporter [Novimethylophilus kurashikiensis]|uniref:MFS transporter n=1 Tax=Novimethylophilus kurashikiensis TaxID=1825523 RepID=A0A2R5F8A0_9PROT|nr:hypothetical protein [Novimethylophilus kurashikiensis]GBG14446.1 MFS transporter [Novimethylophilus kurashikiensis]